MWLLAAMFDAQLDLSCVAVLVESVCKMPARVWLDHPFPYSLRGCFKGS